MHIRKSVMELFPTAVQGAESENALFVLRPLNACNNVIESFDTYGLLTGFYVRHAAAFYSVLWVVTKQTPSVSAKK